MGRATDQAGGDQGDGRMNLGQAKIVPGPRSSLVLTGSVAETDGEPPDTCAGVPSECTRAGRPHREHGFEDVIVELPDLQYRVAASEDELRYDDRVFGFEDLASSGRAPVSRSRRRLPRSEERRVGKECRSRW